MPLWLASQQLADLRHHAQFLVERAGDQEGQLDAFVVATERYSRDAEAVVSHAADDVDVDEVPHLLSAHLERRTAGAATSKRLLVGAHHQHAAACRRLHGAVDA